MAAAVTNGHADDLSDILRPRKKPKLSDLPIRGSKRSAIEGLLHTFKKKGEFDALRKKVYAQYDQT
ncbi:hypothetical protein LTR28_007785, partial [Elasticomyces elasticus]